MPTKHYLAVADRPPGAGAWAILFPGFPGVTSAAGDLRDVMRNAKVALASAVESRERAGEPLPKAVEDEPTPDVDPAAYSNKVALLVPVETASALRVTVTLEEGLLAQIDEVAQRSGVSRSAVLARAARQMITAELPG